MEGIMMRGPKVSAMAVRNPAGELVIEKWENSKKPVPKILKLPIIRGVYGFISSMTIGYKALMRSAEISALDEIEEEMAREKAAKKAAKKKKKDNKTDEILSDTPIEESVADAGEAKDEKKKNSLLFTVITVVSTILGFAIAIGAFVLLPTFLYNLLPIPKFDSMALNSLIKSAFEGVLKIAFLIGYMALVSKMNDIISKITLFVNKLLTF